MGRLTHAARQGSEYNPNVEPNMAKQTKKAVSRREQILALAAQVGAKDGTPVGKLAKPAKPAPKAPKAPAKPAKPTGATAPKKVVQTPAPKPLPAYKATALEQVGYLTCPICRYEFLSVTITDTCGDKECREEFKLYPPEAQEGLRLVFLDNDPEGWEALGEHAAALKELEDEEDEDEEDADDE